MKLNMQSSAYSDAIVESNIMPSADEKKKEKGEDDAVDVENLKERCTAEFLLKKIHAASSIDEKIRLITDHQMRMQLQQQCAEATFYAREEEAEKNKSPEEDVLRARFDFLNELLEFEARKCKLDVALAALRVMKKGETPFYQHKSYGECPFCLDEMFESVTNMRCTSKPVAVHYPCCDNALCYRCCEDLLRKVNEEKEHALQERLLLGARAVDLNKKHFANIESMMKCPFCREPVTTSEIGRTEEHRRCADRGDMMAQFEYGRRLLFGIGVDANQSEGKKLMVEAARKGSIDAKIFLAGQSLGGWEPGGISKAKEYMKDVSGSGHPDGQTFFALQGVISMSEADEIPTEAYDLLVLAAWQLSASAVSLIFSCFVRNYSKKEETIIDKAHTYAKLMFWAERQTKYCSPLPGYHYALQNFGNGFLDAHTCTLPRALYWARRELLEANHSEDEPGVLQYHVAQDAKTVKAEIHQMEHLITSRCASCHQKQSRNIHLNFCNR